MEAEVKKLQFIGLVIAFITSFVFKLHSFDYGQWKAVYSIGSNRVAHYQGNMGQYTPLQKQELLVLLDMIVKNYEQDIRNTNQDFYGYIKTNFAPKMVQIKFLRSQLAQGLGINLNTFEANGQIINNLNQEISAPAVPSPQSRSGLLSYYEAVAAAPVEEYIELNTEDGLREVSQEVPNEAQQSIPLSSDNLELQIANSRVEFWQKICLALMAYNACRFSYYVLKNNPKLAFLAKIAFLGATIFGGYKFAQNKKLIG
jgi:hypothetical protein